ncbi:MAG: STAS/SEC14 domain-containing protein [Synechocystis sp.]
MITKLPESHDSVLGVKITGKVSEAEELEWIAHFDNLVEQYGKVSGLVILGEQAHWGVKAGYEDLKWLITHWDKLNRIAIVSDSMVWKWLVAIDSPFAKLFGIKEKHFEGSDIDAAWAWVSQA